MYPVSNLNSFFDELVRTRVAMVLKIPVYRLLEDREWVERDHPREREGLRLESSLKFRARV